MSGIYEVEEFGVRVQIVLIDTRYLPTVFQAGLNGKGGCLGREHP